MVTRLRKGVVTRLRSKQHFSLVALLPLMPVSLTPPRDSSLSSLRGVVSTDSTAPGVSPSASAAGSIQVGGVSSAVRILTSKSNFILIYMYMYNYTLPFSRYFLGIF